MIKSKNKYLDYKKSIVLNMLIGTLIMRYFLSLQQYPNLFLYRILLPVTTIYVLFRIAINDSIVFNKKNYFILFYYFLYSASTVIWVINFNSYLVELFYLTSNLFLFFIVNILINNKSKLLSAIKTIYLFYILGLIVGLWEVITMNHLRSSKFTIEYNWPVRSTTSWFYNPNEFGIFIVFILPIAYYFLNRSKKTHYKVFNLIIIILSFVLLGYTDSRLSMSASLIQLLLCVLFYNKSKVKRMKISSIIFIGPMFVLSILALFIYNPSFLNNFISRVTSQLLSIFYEGNNIGGSIEVRFQIYKTVIKMFCNSFLAGVGLGQIPEYISGYNISINTTNVHSFIFDIIVETGIPGFLLFMSFIFKVVSDSLRMLKKDINYEEKELIYTILNSIGVYLLITNFGANTVHITSIIWLFLAILTSINRVIEYPNSK